LILFLNIPWLSVETCPDGTRTVHSHRPDGRDQGAADDLVEGAAFCADEAEEAAFAAGLLLAGAGLLVAGAGLLLAGAGLLVAGAGLLLAGAGLLVAGAGLWVGAVVGDGELELGAGLGEL